MNCRACGGDDLEQILDLGEQCIPDFRDDDLIPPKHPLVLLFCPDCFLSQLSETVDRDAIYHERYGFKSGVSDTIRADLRDVVESTLERNPGAESWLDIASNDGTLLSAVPETLYRAGIDPIAKYCEEAVSSADEVVCDFFHADHFPTHEFDIISAVSMFYDLDDPNAFLEEIKRVLAPDGVFVVQQNYLADSLRLGAVDNICHEHVTYFTLLAMEKLLERHDLEVFDVATSDVNGGSLRTWIARKGVRPVRESVPELLRKEIGEGLHAAVGYASFTRRVLANLDELSTIVGWRARQGKRIYIYGASTRGSTIWQAAGFGPETIVCAVERNPEKVGKQFSPIGVPIISEEEARENPPDYMLIGPWFYADEILARDTEMLENGTRAIIPLPEVTIR